MSEDTSKWVQMFGYSAIALVLIGVGLAFMIRRRQYSFGMILIVTAMFVFGFAYYVSQADNLVFEEDSPEMSPELYGTPAYSTGS